MNDELKGIWKEVIVAQGSASWDSEQAQKPICHFSRPLVQESNRDLPNKERNAASQPLYLNIYEN